MTKKQSDIALTIIGTLIFMIFALYNGFPIVSDDSITYISSGFESIVPAERPIFYGYFIRYTSFRASAWLPVFVQCLILSYITIRFIRSIVPSIKPTHLVAILLITALATISSWYAGQLLPDIFTPILFLSLYLYLQGSNTTLHKAILLFIIYMATVFHYSHYAIATTFVLLILIGSTVFRNKLQHYRKRSLQLSIVVALAWASLFSSNYLAGNGFISGKASHVFLMGKLCESGILKKHLDKTCQVKDYEICQYKEELPSVAWEFVWDIEHSPVFKQGGWDSTRMEYKEIISDIASQPKYWPTLAYKSIEATLRQVILLNIDEGEERPWITYDKDHELYKTIDKYFPYEINQFKGSRINIRALLDIPFYDHVYVIIFLLSSVIVLFFINEKHKKTVITVYSMVILFVFINAFATATFGNVLSRLNSRAIWLIPMTNIIFIYLYAKDWAEGRKQA